MASPARIQAATEGIAAGLEQSSLIGKIWAWMVPLEVLGYSGDGTLTLSAADDAEHGGRSFQPVFWDLRVKLPFPRRRRRPRPGEPGSAGCWLPTAPILCSLRCSTSDGPPPTVSERRSWRMWRWASQMSGRRVS